MFILGILLAVFLTFVAIGLNTYRVNWGHRWLNCATGWVYLFCYTYHRLSRNQLQLPETGPAILAANHVSGLDPLLMMCISPRPVRFLIAREVYDRFWLNWIVKAMGAIPVDRAGRPEKALRQAIVALQKGEVIGIFPHGKIITANDNRENIKSGAIRLAQLSECAIYPIHFYGMKFEGSEFLSLLFRAKAKAVFHEPISGGSTQTEHAQSDLIRKMNSA